MASEKPARILRSKSRLTDDDIAEMSDGQAWQHIYALEGQKKDRILEVCFTGFALDDKEELERMAAIGALRLRKSVTKNLDFLVCGDAPGPAKLEKAKGQGVTIMDEVGFRHLLETGEITKPSPSKKRASRKQSNNGVPNRNSVPEVTSDKPSNGVIYVILFAIAAGVWIVALN